MIIIINRGRDRDRKIENGREIERSRGSAVRGASKEDRKNLRMRRRPKHEEHWRKSVHTKM